MPFRPPGGTDTSQPYRSDIDGLRAVAVVAVIIGHSFEGGLPGGYLGVDVFFVISGFVITQSLLLRRDPGFGRFLGAFFVRRIKRLLPALLVCFALTCAVLLVIDSQPKTSLITGAMSLFGLANFALYAQELDYFSASVRYNAFTHTWSLGVEEQFYLLFPVLFWLTLRWANLLPVLITTLSLVSLSAFIILQSSEPTAAYYMMPMRFWELGAGVVAAAVVYRGFVAPAFATTSRATTVLVVLLVAVFLIPPEVGIAGHLLAVLLTTTLLITGAVAVTRGLVLCNPLAEYTGRISYSLYLWHWPFLTFGLLAPFSIMANPFFAIGCAVLASVLSYHFVEQPVRHMHTPVPKARYFGIALASVLVAIFLIAGANDYRKKLPSPIDSAMPISWAKLPDSNETFHPACIVTLYEPGLDLKPDTFKKCTFANLPNGDQRMLWVLGDSHAGHLHGGLFKLRKEFGFGVHLVETPGNGYPSTHEGGFWPRERLMDDVRAQWKAGDVVVLGRLLLSRSEPVEVYVDVPEWLSLVETLATELRSEGINLLMMGPPPMFQFEDLRACNPLDPLSCGLDRTQLLPVVNEVLQGMNAVANRHDNVAVFDAFLDTCPYSTPLCSPIRKGVFTFRDRDHFSVYGAELLMDGFRKALDDFKP